jgi:hypothetical protein
MPDTIAFFKRYPFAPGQKLHIEDGPRKGDWLVTGVDEKKVALRCPVSGVEVSWDRFCYLVEDRQAEFPAGS